MDASRYRSLFALLIYMMFNDAGAILIEADLFAPGDGLVTRDTETSLEWLDLTETLNVSLADVGAGFGGFVTDLGFSIATGLGVSTMLDHAGVTSGLCGGSSVDPTACFPFVAELLNLLGCTRNCYGTTPFARGVYDNVSAIFWGINTVAMTGFATGDIGFGGMADLHTGTFLMRPYVSVRETHIHWLVSIGIAALIIIMRRNRPRSIEVRPRSD